MEDCLLYKEQQAQQNKTSGNTTGQERCHCRRGVPVYLPIDRHVHDDNPTAQGRKHRPTAMKRDKHVSPDQTNKASNLHDQTATVRRHLGANLLADGQVRVYGCLLNSSCSFEKKSSTPKAPELRLYYSCLLTVVAGSNANNFKSWTAFKTYC